MNSSPPPSRRRSFALALVAVVTAVVLVVPAVLKMTAPEGGVTFAPGLSSWPSRGALVDDAALFDRAVGTWLSAAEPALRPRTASIRVVYADTTPPGAVSYTVIVLVADDRVAFVTSPAVDRHNAPRKHTDLRGKLLLRAVLDVDDDATAIGFVATTAHPDDAKIPGGGALGFALAEPGRRVRLATSVAEHLGEPVDQGGAVDGRVLPATAGAWNTALVVDGSVTAPSGGPVAASTLDPFVQHTRLSARPDGLRASGAVEGDLVVTHAGWVGVATTGSRVQTTLPADGQLHAITEITDIPVEILPDGRARLSHPRAAPGNRLILTSAALPQVRVVLGTLTSTTGRQWRLTRAVSNSPATALLVRAQR